MTVRDTDPNPAASSRQQRVTGWSALFTVAVLTLLAAAVIGLAVAQDGGMEELPKGVGPIESIELDEELDLELATLGEETFALLCSACHKLEERYVGPAVLGVTERRSPEWIMNMILAPEIMVWEDETAYDLMAEYMVAMPNQGLDEDRARAILEYFRVLDDEAAE